MDKLQMLEKIVNILFRVIDASFGWVALTMVGIFVVATGQAETGNAILVLPAFMYIFSHMFKSMMEDSYHIEEKRKQKNDN